MTPGFDGINASLWVRGQDFFLVIRKSRDRSPLANQMFAVRRHRCWSFDAISSHPPNCDSTLFPRRSNVYKHTGSNKLCCPDIISNKHDPHILWVMLSVAAYMWRHFYSAPGCPYCKCKRSATQMSLLYYTIIVSLGNC